VQKSKAATDSCYRKRRQDLEKLHERAVQHDKKERKKTPGLSQLYKAYVKAHPDYEYKQRLLQLVELRLS